MILHHSHVLHWKLRTLEALGVVDNHMEALMKVITVIDKVATGECGEEDFLKAYNQYRHEIADRED